MTIADMQRYKYGGLAAKFLKENPALSIGSLEQLASDLGIEDSARGFIEGAASSEEGIKRATSVYYTKYQEAKEDTNIKELYNFYEDEFIKTYIGNIKSTKLKDEINKHSRKKLKDIVNEAKKAKYILDGEESGVTYTPAVIQDAKDTLDKYKKTMSILAFAEEAYFERLRASASQRTFKKMFEEIADKI